MTACAVRFQGVSKSFGAHLAVDRLDLKIPLGSIYGFLGPNGSGKTTALRMLMNLLLPDAGSIEVLGSRGTSAARDRISYLPEERGLYKQMTVSQVLGYFGALKGAAPERLAAALPLWLERLDLLPWAGTKVECLSKGMAQKVQLLAALVSEPELIILDEPFSGLDPVGVLAMKALVLEQKHQGRTVIFSTHQMASAEELCDRVGMLCRGRLVLEGSLAGVMRRGSAGRVRVRSKLGLKALRNLPGVLAATRGQEAHELRVQGDPQAFLRRLLRRTRVELFEIERRSLNEVFLEMAALSEAGHALL